MRKLTYFFALAALLIVGGWGCSEILVPSDSSSPHEGMVIRLDLDDPCGTAVTVALLAGQYIDTGNVTVVNDEDSLRVTIDTRGTGWAMIESHFAVALSLEDLPQTGSGNPKVGHFEYAEEYDPSVSLATYEINLLDYEYEEGTELFLAVHAVVQLLDEGGQPIQEETAWAEGLEFPGQSWAQYFNYTVQICENGSSSELTLIYPNESPGMCTWSESSIMWESVDCGPTVMIELLLDGIPCSPISASTENDGEYSWMPHQCGDTLLGYTIRVTDLESGAWDESDFTFGIGEVFCYE